LVVFAQLDGKAAIVTGGAGFIGSEIAALLARQGALVAVVDLDGDRAAAVTKEISDSGGTASAWTGDLSDESFVSQVFQEMAGALGRVDILVNTAAPLGLVRLERPLAQMPLDVWDQMIQGALRATMLCSRAALPYLQAREGGAIVNLSSIHALAGDTSVVAYAAAKAAIVSLTRSIATQYGRSGVRCNAVCPGTIAPPGTGVDLVAGRVRHQAIGRAGQPGDVAAAVLFLVSDEASFVTGQTITVDGGVLMHLPSYADGSNIQ
jgi:NAD(P)-dependent dehydrogenase (short-subunit alcohol dehydrogenase family)